MMSEKEETPIKNNSDQSVEGSGLKTEKLPESGAQTPATENATNDGTPATESHEAAGDKPADLQKERELFSERVKTYLVEQTKHVVIPSYSKWFDLDTIHQIEKKLFPDFFPNKLHSETPRSVYKTPEAYKHIRDFLVNAYRINPIEYLSVTAVRRNLAGDVATIIRIHKFLEKWGLINYQIDPRTKSSTVGPQYTGHFQITLDTPKGLVPLIPENVQDTKNDLPSPSASSVEPEEETIKSEAGIPLNLELRRNVYNDISSKDNNNTNPVQYFCSITNKETGDVRYHNLKSKTYGNSALNPANASIISSEAFDQGLFPSNFQSSDFVKLQNESSSSNWSEQEVLLLLEGVEMFASFDSQNQSYFVNNNGQWDKVSEHVGTKDREQCLIKFIQLPIEDRYLNKLINSGKDESSSGFDKETIIQEVVKKLITTQQGKDLVKENSDKNLKESIINQQSLINQTIELTLEKFQTKLNLIDNLEKNLIKTENLLNLQRKQLLIERWHNFEKIDKFKKQNNNPELSSLLDDLLTPISINEVNKTFNKVNLDDKKANSSEMEIDKDSAENDSNRNEDENLPISITQPKSYQFWSA
ncbi:SWIRM-domain-containing protein [Hyphopichia burtonii NRRL Y-1933]|uniref:SWIRM-domain-containing protein n=1 Tax=Hyphopichia burtonii NRRL Y-1933 TaxID=984485 RepID=A0A1E4RN19_9ASCO|nr:SWIRM-domain-containing protein [Hyphopichia burtonii NRRL Y-1933]ODV68667.1 SWIRM-domain-containing protein [Hyphopichia burtonii NRRL Y-1933]